MRALIVLCLLAAPSLADELPSDGNAALASCVNAGAQQIRERALADGRTETLKQQVKGLEAQVKALQDEVKDMTTKTSEPPK